MTKIESISMAEEKTAPTATAVLEKPAPASPGELPIHRELTTPRTLSLVPESVARRIKPARNILSRLFEGGGNQPEQQPEEPEDDYSDVLPPLDTSGNEGQPPRVPPVRREPGGMDPEDHEPGGDRYERRRRQLNVVDDIAEEVDREMERERVEMGEREIDIKERDRQIRLRHIRRVAVIDAMDAEEFDKHLDLYIKSADMLHRLAGGSKFADEEYSILEQRWTLERLDELQIQQVIESTGSDEAGEQLRRLLMSLDYYESELEELNSGLKPYYDSSWDEKRPDDAPLPPPEEDRRLLWIHPGEDGKIAGHQENEDRKIKRDQIEVGLKRLRADIATRTGEAFLVGRTSRKENINSKTKEFDQLIKDQQKEDFSSTELNDEMPPVWEDALEREMLTDSAPALAVEIDRFGQLPTFSELQDVIKSNGEGAKATYIDRSGKRVEVSAIELIECYFYWARQLGLFRDSEDVYKGVYEGVRRQLADYSQSPTEDPLEKFSEEHKIKDINNYESDDAWDAVKNRLEEIRNVPQFQAGEIVSYMKGIRGEFIRRSYRQLHTAISVLRDVRADQLELASLKRINDPVTNDKKEDIAEVEQRISRSVNIFDRLHLLRSQGGERLAGGFNITEIEVLIQRREELRGKREEEPYEFEWNQYKLKGSDAKGIEDSAQAATSDLLKTRSTSDVNDILGRMKAINDAVARYGKRVRIDKKDIDRIQRIVKNRVLFDLAPWFGAMVQMDSYTAVMDQWANPDGYDMLATLHTMFGGFIPKALAIRYQPEYRLRYRLDGRAGHFSDNQGRGGQLTQRFIRDHGIEELMVEELMGYMVSGDVSKAKTPGQLNAAFLDRKKEYDRLKKEIEHRRQAGDTITKEEESAFLERYRDPKEVMLEARKEYRTFQKQIKDKREANPPVPVTLSELRRLRDLRKSFNEKRHIYSELRQQAKDAMEFAGNVMDAFGESAKLGAPSVRMKGRNVEVEGRQVEIRELLSIEDLNLHLEHAVMDEARMIGDRIRRDYDIDLDDNGGLIRWRSRYWLSSNTSLPNRTLKVKKRDGSPATLTYQQLFDMFGGARKGFEDTGLTKSEFDASVKRWKLLQEKGTAAIINEKAVREIYQELLNSTGLNNAELRGYLELESRRLRQESVDYSQRIRGRALHEIYQRVIDHPSLGANGFDRFLAAFQSNNFDARIGKTYREVLAEMKDKKPVLNHYPAVDIYGSDILTDPDLQEKARRGGDRFILNIAKRLNWFGFGNVLASLDKYTPATKKQPLNYVFESSRSFHDTMKGLVYYFGTRKDINQVLDEDNYVPILKNLKIKDQDVKLSVKGIYGDKTEFDSSNMLFGFPNIQLGIKRAMYSTDYWMAELDQKVTRGAPLLSFFRIMVNSLSERLGVEDINEVIWNMNKEYFDQPDLRSFVDVMKNAIQFKQRGESSISDKAELVWGFWDKLLADAENLWGLFSSQQGLIDLINGTGKDKRLGFKELESAVSAVEGVLKRYTPMINLMQKSLEYDRGASGTGAGEEVLQKNSLKFLSWLLTLGAEGAQRRNQGGQAAHADTAAIFYYLLQDNSYRGKFEKEEVQRIIGHGYKSIWDRVWDKIKPNHNPGISMDPSSYTTPVLPKHLLVAA